jgi:hypothetical protein
MVSNIVHPFILVNNKKDFFQSNSCKKKEGELWGGQHWTWEKADRSYEDINKEKVSHRNNPEIAAS